jgi:hypothetical protein
MTFLRHAIAWFAGHGVTVERAMTDNGSAYVSYRFRDLCELMKIRHLRIRPHGHRPTGRSSASSKRCFASGRTASSINLRMSASDGLGHTSTSTTSTELTLPLRTMRRSVAWLGRTS